jgi:hypothetical protein
MWRIYLSLALTLFLAACSQVNPVNRDDETLELDPAATALTLYAAPNGSGTACSRTQPCSLLQAKNTARQRVASTNGNIVVQLLGGVYNLGSTLEFTSQDSGDADTIVIYQGSTNGSVRISGGRRLSNWTSVGNGIYKTNVGNLRFRNFYVNNQPATRSREPDGSYYRLKTWDKTGKRLEIDGREISRWGNFGSVEMVVQKHWNQHRLRLGDYSFVNLGTSINLAPRKNVYASGVESNSYPPQNATDENPNTVFSSNKDGFFYWQVDLGQPYPLSRIEIVTRTDANLPWSRKNFEVWGSNKNDSSDLVVLGSQGDTPLPFRSTWNKTITDTKAYRYISVVGIGGPISFAEVRVFKKTTTAESSAFVVPKNPERQATFELDNPPADLAQAYHFENAREFVDTPGEFYLDPSNGDLYYKLRSGETASSLEAYAPALGTVMRVNGASKVRFSNIVFELADWLEPSSIGFVGIQGPIHLKAGQGTAPMSAGVSVENSGSIYFSRSTFRHMGATGLSASNGTRTFVVNGCRFEDLGGQGLAIDPNAAAPSGSIQGVTITNNSFTRLGRHYAGVTGIFIGFASNVRIEHNELWDLPYTAISAGWGWSFTETRTNKITIRYNDIWNVVNLLDDGGAIYTLSSQPGTLIAENYIHDIQPSPWWGGYLISGVYLDEGSKNILVKDNVILNVPNRIKGTGNTLQNNEGNSQSVIAKAGKQPGY